MSRRKMTCEDLVAVFEAKAKSPPNQHNELLVRHLKCEEALHLAGAMDSAIRLYRTHNTETLSAPSELLSPLG